MPSYFDSSFLLAALLDQPGKSQLAPVWDDEPTRVASILLETECVTVLRRAATAQPAAAADGFLAARLKSLDDYLNGITLKFLDEDVSRCLRRETRLGSCRTLDAVHLATALLFQEQLETPLMICSLDERLREVAVRLGFPVTPRI